MAFYSARNVKALQRNEDPENFPASYVHPFWGISFTDPRDDKVVQNAVTLQDEYKDYIGRELGLNQEIIKNNRILKGLADPGAYLFDMNRSLEQIRNTLADIYRQQYIYFYNKGYTSEEAKKYAIQYTEEAKKTEMKKHYLDFPTELTREAMGKFERRNQLQI